MSDKTTTMQHMLGKRGRMTRKTRDCIDLSKIVLGTEMVPGVPAQDSEPARAETDHGRGFA